MAHSFVASQTAYCPLIWSFSNRTAMAKLERVNEKANSLFLDTTQKADTNLHRRYCESLLKEVFKTKFDLNPSYMKSVFPDRICPYNLRSGDSIARNRIRTTKHGLQKVSHIGTQMWDSLPESDKTATSVNSFCRSLRKLDSLKCTCRLCASYVCDVGYIT